MGGRALRALAALLALAGAAQADPVFPAPVIGRQVWGDDPEEPALMGLLAEMRAVGVLAIDRLASWPARRLGLEAQVPALVAARAGFVAELRDAPFTFVVRADLGEPWRPWVDAGVGKVLDTVVADAYAVWRAARAAHVLVGRARVPWSKSRETDELDEPLGAPPFMVDRVAPDRRWGAMLLGDLDTVGYYAGAWEDLDDLEARARVGDPSSGGAVAAAAGVEWTPIAPMAGSRGPLPSPRKDPLYDTARLSFGAGLLGRLRQDGSARADGALSAQVKWRWMSALVELLAAHDAGTDLGGHAAIMVTPIDRVALALRGELDGGAPGGGEWALEGAVQYHVTKDRRNRIGVVAWLRRDLDRGSPYDGLVVFLQASL